MRSMVKFENLLRLMGFKPLRKNILAKAYKKFDCRIKVDFSTRKILYPPALKAWDATTCNPAKEENLVVLDCVDRLLEKGYPPDRIELEKKWPLGRRSGGKLDILVKKADSDDTHLMIECKTPEEFEKETERMLKDGGQLFSYWQQSTDADVLCLYASALKDGKIEYQNNIVLIDDRIRSSASVKEAVDRWNKQFLSKGVLESDIAPYNAAFKPLTKGDLKPLSKADGDRVFHHFLEILRHNVVSDKGNAFNKLFNLFLCKILDEDRPENEELEFQYVDWRDDAEDLLTRLNGLYKRGMSRYMDKDITDYDPDDVSVDDGNEKIRKIIKELRLYRNQEFAFVDIFNRDTFNENAAIIIQIVRLLQGWRIRYTRKQQFLGEFFELLLNTGFKQESGQFFTPAPLVRFILKSLPIREIMENKIAGGDEMFLPHIIDFACGSGHFLTEAMDIFQDTLAEAPVEKMTPAQKKRYDGYRADEFGWAKEYVYGIERDYRLAKTSKLATFLHGDGEAVIVHASGINPLESYFGKHGQGSVFNKGFDILVANPPYAVKGFKSTIQTNRNGERPFSLYSHLTDKSDEIEVLFIERMAQIVKAGGVAGIILPRSILNRTGVYELARKMIFEHFMLKGLVVLGGNAFMATGINTIVMFLKKRSEPLNLDGKKDYEKMSSDAGNLVLANSHGGEVEKRFLGYEFSRRKGQEGIKVKDRTMLFDEENRESRSHANSHILRAIRNDAVDRGRVAGELSKHVRIVPLRDLFDWEGEEFSNAIFVDGYEVLSDSDILRGMDECVAVLETGSRPRGGVSGLSEGVGSLGGQHIDEDRGEIAHEKMKYVSEAFFQGMTSGHVRAEDILLCKDGERTGKCAYFPGSDERYCVNEHVFIIRSNEKVCVQKYLFYFMMSSFFKRQVKKLSTSKKGQAGLNRGHMKRIKVPVPPLKKQKALVLKIEKGWGDARGKGERAELAERVFREIGLRHDDAWERAS